MTSGARGGGGGGAASYPVMCCGLISVLSITLSFSTVPLERDAVGTGCLMNNPRGAAVFDVPPRLLRASARRWKSNAVM